MDFITSIKSCFVKYVDFKGRASRAEFWNFMLFCVLIIICGDIVDAQLVGQSFWDYDSMFGPTALIINILIALPGLSVSARRLHDIDKSGWWQLIYITIIGIIPLIFWLCKSSSQETNKYGNPALTDANDKVTSVYSSWVKFLLLSIAVLIICVSALYATLLTIGILPDSKIVSGPDLNSSTRSKLINKQIIDKNSKILYFYTTGIYSFTNEGQLMTDDSVISYAANDEGIIQTWKMEFNEIKSIELILEGSYFKDSIYKIYGNEQAEYEWIEVWLSTEKNGDKIFIDELRKRMN